MIMINNDDYLSNKFTLLYMSNNSQFLIFVSNHKIANSLLDYNLGKNIDIFTK